MNPRWGTWGGQLEKVGNFGALKNEKKSVHTFRFPADKISQPETAPRWIPAFAGMTIQNGGVLGGIEEGKCPSFKNHIHKNIDPGPGRSNVIPANAGIQVRSRETKSNHFSNYVVHVSV